MRRLAHGIGDFGAASTTGALRVVVRVTKVTKVTKLTKLTKLTKVTKERTFMVRAHNFNPGPAGLPLPALERAQKSL